MTKLPNPVDRHVGSRLRELRNGAGLSQEKLGVALGVTFQQVQKYEKGLNRLGASRLQSAARVLGVPVNTFFDGLPSDAGSGLLPGSAAFDPLRRPPGADAAALLEAFNRLGDPGLKARVVELVQAMAARDED
jgi:transcriptional regulator with XRE-family HTH domain